MMPRFYQRDMPAYFYVKKGEERIMSAKEEAKKVQETGEAIQGALNVPIVKYAVIGVLVIAGLFVVKLLFL